MKRMKIYKEKVVLKEIRYFICYKMNLDIFLNEVCDKLGVMMGQIGVISGMEWNRIE